MKLNCALPLLGLLIMMVSANTVYIDKKNITGILYPSEDTNKNRIPIHVSDQVRCYALELFELSTKPASLINITLS